MKKIFMTGLIVILSATLCIKSYAKSAQELDQILVIVNDDVITQSELNQALSMMKMQIAQAQMPVPPEAILQKQTLDQLINKKLQLQIAKQAGVHITDNDLDKAIERIAAQNNVSIDALYQRINQEGMKTADYRNEIRDQMTLQKLQQQEVVNRITITPQEVDTFMHSKIWQSNGTKEYRLEDILIPLSDTPSPAEITEAKKRAMALITKLHQGQNFREVAQAESSEKHALEGGDLGWRKLPEIPSAFAEQVTRMQVKEIAGPIQTSNGFHIIRLTDARAATDAQATPNRKQVEELLMQRKFEEAMQNWVSKLRGQAFISKIA
ncbi:peptidylprolyl isomerase [Aquicella lusitana]|uniref:Peptidyl-prolyl cis-trans isomerase SurA n=1 Tax=Aquicella lusitana TaxID=254246 RepID=A0A370GCQ4_9COXI|nr:peptidylprolyl isomerase [Aquicella lusitana]RDI41491.1 peptidyl-prolyl cis-trans isomerase SurA [Aquicella lusitana]VVC72615.1 Chaperone SurA [Aquicella lusitana]